MDLRVQTLGHKKTLVKTRVFKWCPDADSNHGHKDFQSFALPTELSGRCDLESLLYLFGKKVSIIIS